MGHERTEMANDTITDAAEEMPASDDGRRKLLEGHEGHSDDDTMDMMNDTMMNMTMNGTEMADDEIEGEDAEEMPASDDGRRKLLAGHEGHSYDDTMDMMNDTMMNMTANATEMANDTITDAAEEMPASVDGRRKLLAGHEGHSDDDTMDLMNDTMGNMTMNGTDDMANDTIAEDPEEMPASDDGREALLNRSFSPSSLHCTFACH